MGDVLMMGEEQLQGFITGARWKETSYGGAPHAYTHRKWNDEGEFEAFVTTIRANGYKQAFKGHRCTYLDVDGYQYWTMGWPVEKTVIINRAKTT